MLDANLYYALDGSSDGTWQWKGADYGDFDTWRSRSGNDRHSMFADPGFVDPAAQDFSLVASSPAVDAGAFAATSGSTDLAGGPRAQGGSVDMGAFEAEPPPPSPTPSIAGAVTYAGDLPWLQVRNGWGDPEIDRSNGERAPDDGVPIMIGTRSFEHGIGAHAPSRIVVELDGRCSLFLADVGVDEEVGEAGSVVFEVWAGDERLTTSGPVRGAQAPVPMAADVERASSVTLVVTTAGDGPANDHADWGDARFACEG